MNEESVTLLNEQQSKVSITQPHRIINFNHRRIMAFGGSLAMILACAPFCAEIMLAGYFGTYIYYEDGLKEFTSINAMFMILIQIGAHVFTDPIAAFMFKRLNGKLMVTLGYALLLLCMATMLFAKTSTT